MRLNEISYNDANPIDGYGPGFFRVGGKVYHDALLLSGAGTVQPLQDPYTTRARPMLEAFWSEVPPLLETAANAAG